MNIMAAPKRTSTHEARMGKKRKAQVAAEAAGTLEQLQARLWSAITRIDGIINDDSADSALGLRASHALFQGAAAFSKVLEVGELEGRLDALEEALAGRRSMATNGAYAS